MQVKTVSASIRYSKPVGDGSFKTVEISAEGTITPDENWQDAQSQLYDRLAGQLRQMWRKKRQKTNDNGPTNTSGADNADTSLSEPNTPETSKKNGHFCVEHNVTRKRYEKNGHSWFSHRTDGGWCNEKKPKAIS